MQGARIEPATFTFLARLAENNHRDWFLANKPLHDAARENVIDFVGSLVRGISQFDKCVPADLDPKSCVMRIYRDVRFSKNKDPYKTNFGIAISEHGKNFQGPGYYMHIHPVESFISAGLWMPEPEMLKAVRQEIDYNQTEFLDIVEAVEFAGYFGGPDKEHILKTVPRAYPPDHPLIEYLKLKSFTFTHVVQMPELTSNNASDLITDGFRKAFPFMQFLRQAVH